MLEVRVYEGYSSGVEGLRCKSLNGLAKAAGIRREFTTCALPWRIKTMREVEAINGNMVLHRGAELRHLTITIAHLAGVP